MAVSELEVKILRERLDEMSRVIALKNERILKLEVQQNNIPTGTLIKGFAVVMGLISAAGTVLGFYMSARIDPAVETASKAYDLAKSKASIELVSAKMEPLSKEVSTFETKLAEVRATVQGDVQSVKAELKSNSQLSTSQVKTESRKLSVIINKNYSETMNLLNLTRREATLQPFDAPRYYPEEVGRQLDNN